MELKVSDKIGIIKNLLPKVNALLIGGGMAYTFLKAKGIDIGKSLVETDKVSLARELLAQATEQGVSTVLPVDHVTGDSERKNPTVCMGNIPADRMGLGYRTANRRSILAGVETGENGALEWPGGSV